VSALLNEPDDTSTQLILDAIATHNQSIEAMSDRVRATFFIISSHLCKGTTIIDRILEQGHEIGNHGTADETTVLLHRKVFAAQLNAAHECITQQYHQPLRWYRPGFAVVSTRTRVIQQSHATLLETNAWIRTPIRTGIHAAGRYL